MEIDALHSKFAEVNGTKPKSLRYKRVNNLTDSKRAEQGNDPYSALKVFLWEFSATILRPLTSARNYATIADPKKQIREAYFNRITAPKKSRAKNNTNSEKEFVLFSHGAETGI